MDPPSETGSMEDWMKHTLEAPHHVSALALAIFGIVFGGTLSGCVSELVDDTADVDLGGDPLTDRDDALIIGAIDWQEASSLPQGSAQRANADAVAYVSIPRRGSRCTGFLVAPDVLMTNHHCIPDAASAAGVTAQFRYEAGATNDTRVDCSGFIGNDAALDYALLRCASRPGDVVGVVGLDTGTARTNEGVYAIHQNCDYYTQSNCRPNKKYSPGKVTRLTAEIGHDADTLGGSSGSPVFAADTHNVIGLHHSGSGNNGNGRGTVNWAVPMSRIVPAIQQRHPGLQLGAQTPSTPSTPSTPINTGDGYEPNNTLSGATRVAAPFNSQGARLDTGDVDAFAFTGAGQHTFILTLGAGSGNLDLYILNTAGQTLARAASNNTTERLSGTVRGDVIIAVAGRDGATGNYSLQVR